MASHPQAPYPSRLCRPRCRHGAGCRCCRKNALSALPKSAPSQGELFRRDRVAAMEPGCR